MSELMQLARKHKPIKQYLKTFIPKYEELFVEFRFDELKILEIGVGYYKNKAKGGGSLRMWSEYFPNSKVVGIDVHDKELELPENVSFELGSQDDTDFLGKVVDKHGPFDIVIDDASHVTKKTVSAFEFLYPLTKRVYVVEDLHLKRAKGTAEFLSTYRNSDFSTEHMCVLRKL
jgi:hypothetical protein